MPNTKPTSTIETSQQEADLRVVEAQEEQSSSERRTGVDRRTNPEERRISERRASETRANPQGTRVFPPIEAPLVDTECHIRRLKATLLQAQREAAELHARYRDTQDWVREIQETIESLSLREFIHGKGILKVKGRRLNYIPKETLLAKPEKAVKKSGGVSGVLDLLKKTNPSKYQLVIKAMLANGAELPESHQPKPEEA